MRNGDSQRIHALRGILALELQLGCEDTAIIGGLDTFLQRFADEIAPVIGDAPKYASLSLPQRREWIGAALARLPAAPAPPPRRPPKSPPPKPAPLALGDDVSRVWGVAREVGQRLRRLGLNTVEDLLHHYPTRHIDFSDVRRIADLQYGQRQSVLGEILEIAAAPTAQGRSSAHATLTDESGGVRLTWFNQGYLARTLTPGTRVFVSGKVGAHRGTLRFDNPEWELARAPGENTRAGRILPVYPLVEGLYQRTLRGIVGRALQAALPQVEEWLPEDLLHRAGLFGLRSSIAQLHHPDTPEAADAARRRLAFDEMFLLQLSVLRRKSEWREEETGVSLRADLEDVTAFVDSLPFALTAAQKRASREILADLQSDRPMSRLLEGDVGSGKTVVAALAILTAALNGCQAVLLAPTEILAEQHFITLTRLLGRPPLIDRGHIVTVRPGRQKLTVGLLLGSLSKRVKDDMRLMIAAGQVDVIIGTHAVIQENVEIPNLALAVVDEQHRFGVMQRAALREKGRRPHLLVMSATPIPRSLALTLYGELDVSIIDEMPPGRPPIVTRYESPERREVVYDFVRQQIRAGRQAFIVLPFIEEAEVRVARISLDSGAPYLPTPGEDTQRTKFVKGAVNEFERLSREEFSDLRVGLLHGRMSLREKESVMEAFHGGELDILVSTPVVEVGIDVPNATVMLIDGADRFGLAQLHQFRGRVGRGKHESYCILLAEEPGGAARERLKLIEQFADGFKLAEKDLDLRGPGDYLGTRQSGVPLFKIAKVTDQDLIALSRREGERLLSLDPALEKPEHAALASRLHAYEETLAGEMS